MKNAAAAGLVLGLISLGAGAAEPNAGDWLVRVGYLTVMPKADNASVLGGTDNIQVSRDDALTFNVSYFFTPAIAVELQAATPFNHDVNLVDVGKVASVKHLPPTLNLQYHFNGLGEWKPYVGAGVNYTIFWGEATSGALAGTDLSLDNSFGLDVQAGVDYDIGNNWYLNGEVRYIDIDSDAKLNGSALATVSIDPFVWAVNVGRKF